MWLESPRRPQDRKKRSEAAFLVEPWERGHWSRFVVTRATGSRPAYLDRLVLRFVVSGAAARINERYAPGRFDVSSGFPSSSIADRCGELLARPGYGSSPVPRRELGPSRDPDRMRRPPISKAGSWYVGRRVRDRSPSGSLGERCSAGRPATWAERQCDLSRLRALTGYLSNWNRIAFVPRSRVDCSSSPDVDEDPTASMPARGGDSRSRFVAPCHSPMSLGQGAVVE